MPFPAPLEEKQLFFKRWMRSPLSLGAILPSSKSLAKLVASTVVTDNAKAIQEGKIIVEIGAGTGSFTAALLEAGIPKKQIICVELDPTLFQYLTKRFPQLLTIQGDASKLRELLPSTYHDTVASVVSGIPMLPLPEHVQQAIVHSAFDLLDERGTFYQFTYSPFSSIPAKNFALQKRRVGTVFLNFPPATVWAYTQGKKAHTHGA